MDALDIEARLEAVLEKLSSRREESKAALDEHWNEDPPACGDLLTDLMEAHEQYVSFADVAGKALPLLKALDRIERLRREAVEHLNRLEDQSLQSRQMRAALAEQDLARIHSIPPTVGETFDLSLLSGDQLELLRQARAALTGGAEDRTDPPERPSEPTPPAPPGDEAVSGGRPTGEPPAAAAPPAPTPEEAPEEEDPGPEAEPAPRSEPEPEPEPEDEDEDEDEDMILGDLSPTADPEPRGDTAPAEDLGVADAAVEAWSNEFDGALDRARSEEPDGFVPHDDIVAEPGVSIPGFSEDDALDAMFEEAIQSGAEAEEAPAAADAPAPSEDAGAHAPPPPAPDDEPTGQRDAGGPGDPLDELLTRAGFEGP